jgi:hypothetical protein
MCFYRKQVENLWQFWNWGIFLRFLWGFGIFGKLWNLWKFCEFCGVLEFRIFGEFFVRIFRNFRSFEILGVFWNFVEFGDFLFDYVYSVCLLWVLVHLIPLITHFSIFTNFSLFFLKTPKKSPKIKGQMLNWLKFGKLFEKRQWVPSRW